MKQSILAALISLSLSAPVLAADYYVVVPMPGKVTAAASNEAITVTLNSYDLPAGMVNTPYSFDLNTVLDVQGDAAYNADNVAWSLVDGATPEGIALQADGTLTGTPTVKNEAGASFEVKASYKGKDGRQSYTIVVGEQVLQATQIASGSYASCAISEGAVYCWGSSFGSKPRLIAGLEHSVTYISAGANHYCAIQAGAAKCWGSNSNGQLGNGTQTNSLLSAVPVSTLTSGVTHIAASKGNPFTCAIQEGAAKCWGHNGNYQLGDGTSTSRTSPVQVSQLLSGVTAITTGRFHGCAVHNGAAKCWGHNGTGQLGSVVNDSTIPIVASGLSADVTQISAEIDHTCAIQAGGAHCWGDNAYGQLGRNSALALIKSPGPVTSLTSGVSAISAGERHVCAIQEGAVWCWGSNGALQLGVTGVSLSRVPVATAGLAGAVSAISAGGQHTCAMIDTAYCWGLNNISQLGNQSTTNSATPVRVQF